MFADNMFLAVGPSYSFKIPLHELRLAVMKRIAGALFFIFVGAVFVPAQRIDHEALARTVTIYRDRFGVPIAVVPPQSPYI